MWRSSQLLALQVLLSVAQGACIRVRAAHDVHTWGSPLVPVPFRVPKEGMLDYQKNLFKGKSSANPPGLLQLAIAASLSQAQNRALTCCLSGLV